MAEALAEYQAAAAAPGVVAGGPVQVQQKQPALAACEALHHQFQAARRAFAERR